MQRITMVVVALAAVGIVSAFLSSQLVPRHQAGAAPPPPQPQQVSITSPVDGTGNVRVSGTTNPPAGRLRPPP
ncbi:MAG: hypothetical protein E6I38_13560 [Chloroflexi bacterium]|nr:MAG: hypothetical protein E6I38_13560 [Chloroflexota bacterium]